MPRAVDLAKLKALVFENQLHVRRLYPPATEGLKVEDCFERARAHVLARARKGASKELDPFDVATAVERELTGGDVYSAVVSAPDYGDGDALFLQTLGELLRPALPDGGAYEVVHVWWHWYQHHACGTDARSPFHERQYTATYAVHRDGSVRTMQPARQRLDTGTWTMPYEEFRHQLLVCADRKGVLDQAYADACKALLPIGTWPVQLWSPRPSVSVRYIMSEDRDDET